jgi:hypothetical protein
MSEALRKAAVAALEALEVDDIPRAVYHLRAALADATKANQGLLRTQREQNLASHSIVGRSGIYYTKAEWDEAVANGLEGKYKP